MARVRRLILIWSIAVVTALGVALPAQAATTTAETGPLNPHTPQTYVYNFGTRDLTNKETGDKIMSGFDSGKCPVLLPGDSVETVAEPTKDNGESRKGFGFVDDDDFPGASRHESRGPIEVTDSEDWGGVTYITGFTNAGDNPVLVWANTCGTASSEKAGDNAYHDFLMYDLNFVIFPATIDVRYECLNEGGSFSDAELAQAVYNTSEKNPTLFYAEDALENRTSGDDHSCGLTVHRPFIEGYQFTGSSHAWDAWTTIYEVYGADDGWDGDATEIYPQWRGSSSNTQALNGKPTDHLTMQFKYKRGRTITLDAMGGTIDGLDRRIVECEGADFDAKAMDEALYNGDAWVPKRPGYEFAGWYTDEDYTELMESFAAEFGKLKADSADVAGRTCHLYARWTEFPGLMRGAMNRGGDDQTTGSDDQGESTATQGEKKAEAAKQGEAAKKDEAKKASEQSSNGNKKSDSKASDKDSTSTKTARTGSNALPKTNDPFSIATVVSIAATGVALLAVGAYRRKQR